MKVCYLIYLLIFSITTNAQNSKDSFIIQGNIPWLKNTTLNIAYHELSYPKRDSARVDNNGDFIFKGQINEPAIATLFASRFSKEPLFVQFFLEKELYTIKENLDLPQKIEIMGGEDQESYQNLSVKLNEFKKISDSLFKLYQLAETVKDQEEMKRLEVLMDPYSKRKRELTNQFIASHRNSFVSLLLLYDILITNHEKFVIVEKLFADLDTTIQKSATGELTDYILSVRRKSSIGATAMDFTLTDGKGDSIKLSDFRGKYVFLDFWASWCKPCRIQNPRILKAFNRFKDKNFTVLGVSLDTDRDKWEKAIKDDQLNWTQLFDPKGFSSEPAQKYLIRSVPVNFLLDPDGVIIAKDIRGDELEKELEKRLQ